MQSIIRVVLPIGLVLALVGGVTFMTQYTPPAPVKPVPKPAADEGSMKAFDGPSLLITDRVAVWDRQDVAYNQEFELNAKGYHDFWVGNAHTVPARVFLKTKSCTCAEVQLGIVGAGAVKAALGSAAALNATFGLTGSAGADLSGLPLTAVMKDVRFQPLTLAGAALEVPPADPLLGIQPAVIRMTWDTKNLGAQRLTADLQLSGGKEGLQEAKLEVPIVGVPAVQFRPMAIDIGVLTAGTVRTIDYVFWSATRDAFPLVPPALPDDPCIVISTPLPLSAEECRVLAGDVPERMDDSLRARFRDQPPTRVLAGYRVRLTVHERLGDHQLDLGPFNRRFVFNANTPYQADLNVSGVVLGDVRLDGGDQIKLGDFPADTVKVKEVLVTANDPRAEVQMTAKSPEELVVAVRRKPGTLATWDLRLTVPANALSGPLPAGSFVLLHTTGPSPRRVRVPVSGTAYLR